MQQAPGMGGSTGPVWNTSPNQYVKGDLVSENSSALQELSDTQKSEIRTWFRNNGGLATVSPSNTMESLETLAENMGFRKSGVERMFEQIIEFNGTGKGERAPIGPDLNLGDILKAYQDWKAH